MKEETDYTGLIISLLLIVSLAFFILGCSAFSDEEFNLGYKLYVPNMSADTITIVPAEKSLDTEIITLENSIQQILRVPNKNEAFVLGSATNEITVIDAETDEIEEVFVFEVGASSPQTNLRMIFSPDGSKAYVATDYEPAGVAVMNVEEQNFTTGINVQSTSVNDFFFSADNSRLYAVDKAMGQIYVINIASNSLIETIEIPESFTYVVLIPTTGHFLFAADGSPGGIKEFDPATDTYVRRLDDIVDNIVRLHLTGNENQIYVLGNDELALVDNEEDFNINEINTLDYQSPTDFRFLPGNEYLLIPSSSADLIMALDPEAYTTEEIISTDSFPGEIVIFDKVAE
ncbi:MAG: YncE family protein [Vulcanimicrobiota bacterium]